ncbi:CLAVATA3/ESR CLE-related protein 1-like [Gigaspora margarita]|uniref:CLAVATA3/ESR CLE-related protein 1-like n=2 Tax=Gigaspora margarita TaxID=4874 RepID=A0A8H4EHU1_GIGMA|nr:CLAVATA3/ESR CLE-related protein 1-like [Gigaspora margarita]
MKSSLFLAIVLSFIIIAQIYHVSYNKKREPAGVNSDRTVPNPLHNKREDPTKVFLAARRIVTSGPNPLHNKREDPTKVFLAARRIVTSGPNPLHNKREDPTKVVLAARRIVTSGPNPLHNKREEPTKE